MCVRKIQLLDMIWVSKKAFNKMCPYRFLEKLSSDELKAKVIA